LLRESCSVVPRERGVEPLPRGPEELNVALLEEPMLPELRTLDEKMSTHGHSGLPFG
jgi:hypothetical protein